MKNEQEQNLILFGYKSSGKSFYGSLLAKELETSFLDTDHFNIMLDPVTQEISEKAC